MIFLFHMLFSVLKQTSWKLEPIHLYQWWKSMRAMLAITLARLVVVKLYNNIQSSYTSLMVRIEICCPFYKMREIKQRFSRKLNFVTFVHSISLFEVFVRWLRVNGQGKIRDMIKSLKQFCVTIWFSSLLCGRMKNQFILNSSFNHLSFWEFFSVL